MTDENHLDMSAQARFQRLAREEDEADSFGPNFYIKAAMAAGTHLSFDNPEDGRTWGERVLHEQIARLAAVIIDEVPGEPSIDEGAIDCAIRLLRAAYVKPPAEPEPECYKGDVWVRFDVTNPETWPEPRRLVFVTRPGHGGDLETLMLIDVEEGATQLTESHWYDEGNDYHDGMEDDDQLYWLRGQTPALLSSSVPKVDD